MAGEFYIAHNTKTDEYLAEKLFRGFYMTPDVTEKTTVDYLITTNHTDAVIGMRCFKQIKYHQ